MKTSHQNLIVIAKNTKELRQFYNFQKDYSGELHINIPTPIKEWRKKK